MRKFLRFLGVVMTLQGISGVIDHLAAQPFMGFFLNSFHRFVVERFAFLDGYEVLANLTLAILGVILLVATERTAPR